MSPSGVSPLKNVCEILPNHEMTSETNIHRNWINLLYSQTCDSLFSTWFQNLLTIVRLTWDGYGMVWYGTATKIFHICIIIYPGLYWFLNKYLNILWTAWISEKIQTFIKRWISTTKYMNYFNIWIFAIRWQNFDQDWIGWNNNE